MSEVEVVCVCVCVCVSVCPCVSQGWGVYASPALVNFVCHIRESHLTGDNFISIK